MTNDSKTMRLPPYVSYKTWSKLMDGLANFLPDVIDNSVFIQMKFSGTDAKRLRTALRYLNLIDDNGVPHEDLRNLLKARLGEGNKTEIVAIIMKKAYPLLSDSSFNLATATSKQLTDRFESMGATGIVQRLCINFFLQMAAEAGMEISPQLGHRSKTGYGRPSVARKLRQKQRQDARSVHEPKQNQQVGEQGASKSIAGLDIDASVAGVLYLLPHKGQKWDKGSKERFKLALSAILDAVYPNEIEAEM
jgi:hypothetical protein